MLAEHGNMREDVAEESKMGWGCFGIPDFQNGNVLIDVLTVGYAVIIPTRTGGTCSI